MIRVALVATACVLLVPVASAQPKKTNADTLFAEGQHLIDAHKIDEACDKFLASLELEPALGTRLNLADCRERQGRFVDAYELYTVVVDEATRGGKQGQLAFARQRLDALAQKLVRVTLKVAEPQLVGLVIKLADKPVTANDLARPIVVMPGSVAVSASAPDHEPFEVARDARAGDQITVEIPALAVHHDNVVPPPAVRTSTGPQRSHTPWIVGGSGAGVVVVSMIVALHAKSRYDDGNAMTAPMGNTTIHSAYVEANVATVMFVVGAVAVGAGAYLYVREGHTQIAPTSDGHGAGVALTGAW